MLVVQMQVHTSCSLSIKSKSRLKYRCIATSKVRNEKDKKLERTHCEVMLFSFEGMTQKKIRDDSKGGTTRSRYAEHRS